MKKGRLMVLAFLLVGLAGAAWAQQSGQVVITEIMYNPASSEATTETQYIEIANVTGSSINLNGWTIDDEDSDGPNTLPNVVLPAYGVAVIVGSNAADFNGAWGAALAPGAVVISLYDLGQQMFNLSNSPSATSEIVQLRDAGGNLVDEVNYDDYSPWPADNNQSSIYLNLSNSQIIASGATDNDNGANWALAQAGTAGCISSTPTGVWDATDVGGPGNVNSGLLPVELLGMTVR